LLHIEILPTVAEVPKGESLRVTISTADTPPVLPTADELANLAGAVRGATQRRGALVFRCGPVAGGAAHPGVRAVRAGGVSPTPRRP
jgi:hypothetical protein